MSKIALLFLLGLLSGWAHGTTWYVRADGGTRFSANVPAGQCNGKFDASYTSTGGTGTNQNCAFNDFRYLWSDNFSTSLAWVISGGDTVIIRGCAALPSQTNPANPACRLGYDIGTNGNPPNSWCPSIGPYLCYNPTIPAGTAGAHTRILGQCVLAGNCNSGNTTNRGNLTQLFAGFGLTWAFNVGSTQYVDVEGIELTTHNGACSHHGAPPWPRGCSTSPPLDDYADNGFLTNNTTANIVFQDVYVDGFESNGFNGSIGGPITYTRVNSSFNAQSGVQFDDGSDTPDAAGSQVLGSYVTMIGNGCKQEYPLVHAFPALACWDTNSGGFGDGWSGQDTVLDVFNCDHCTYMWNSKDADIGPHTQITNLLVTNNFWYGNMGAQIKHNNSVGATHLIQNNLIAGNCYRMSETVPGAGQNFAQSTGLGGSYLTGYCRASGATVANPMRGSSSLSWIGNTFMTAAPIVFEYGCGVYVPGNIFNPETNCGTTVLTVKGNNFIGYTDPIIGGAQVGLYSFDDAFAAAALVSSFNNEFNLRNGDTCGTNNITCVNPLMTSQPTQPWPGSEAALDVFNALVGGNSFYPTSASPIRGAGVTVAGLTTDYYGTTRPSPPAQGGVELGGVLPVVATPTCAPAAGTYATAQTVTCSSTTPASTTYCTIDGSTPTTGSTVCTSISVSSTLALKAISAASGFTNSSILTQNYTITPITPVLQIGGQIVISGTVKVP